jgi:hypothetical protein
MSRHVRPDSICSPFQCHCRHVVPNELFRTSSFEQTRRTRGTLSSPCGRSRRADWERSEGSERGRCATPNARRPRTGMASCRTASSAGGTPATQSSGRTRGRSAHKHAATREQETGGRQGKGKESGREPACRGCRSSVAVRFSPPVFPAFRPPVRPSVPSPWSVHRTRRAEQSRAEPHGALPAGGREAGTADRNPPSFSSSPCESQAPRR